MWQLLLKINGMKFSVFGHKDTTTKYNNIFENSFRHEGIAIHLCNFGRYLILLNMMFIERNQQNEEWSIGTHLVVVVVVGQTVGSISFVGISVQMTV